MKKAAIIVISLLVISVLVVSGFIFLASQSEEDSAGPAPDTANIEMDQSEISGTNPAGTSPTGAEDAANGDTTDTPDVPSEQNANYTIDMFSFGYSISRIEASPGDTITIEFTNSNGTHNFVIDELNVRSDTINTGGKTLVTFTIPADAAGKTFAYYCSLMNHRAQGMEGQLVISE